MVAARSQQTLKTLGLNLNNTLKTSIYHILKDSKDLGYNLHDNPTNWGARSPKTQRTLRPCINTTISIVAIQILDSKGCGGQILRTLWLRLASITKRLWVHISTIIEVC